MLWREGLGKVCFGKAVKACSGEFRYGDGRSAEAVEASCAVVCYVALSSAQAVKVCQC
jgi:hypothetical protein